MAAAVGSLRIDLFANLAEFRNGLNKASGELARFERKSRRTAQNFEAVGARLSLGLTLPLGYFAVQAKNAARDAEELQSAFDYTFGDMAAQANAWAETTGNAFSRSTQQMQANAFALGGLFKAAAPTEQAAYNLSTAFSELAVDAASFFNTTDDEALQKIRAGLSGESEPLRRFNVFLTEGKVKARAFELGIANVGDELTDQQKILARASLIYEGLADAQGDAVRTSQSLANQERALSSEYQEQLVLLGKELRPVFLEIVKSLRGLLKVVNDLTPAQRKLILSVAGLAAALGPLLLGIGSLIRVAGFAAGGLATLAAKMGATGTAAKFSTGRVLGFAAALTAAYSAGQLLGDALFKQIEKSDEALKVLYVLPKALGGYGGKAEDAARAVELLRKKESEQVDESQAVRAEIDELVKGFGNMSEAVALTESEIDGLRSVIDPVGQLLKQYNENLDLAARAGFEAADAEKAFAREAVAALGGIDPLTGQIEALVRAGLTISDLPPAWQDAFYEMRDAAEELELDQIAKSFNDAFDFEGNIERRLQDLGAALASGKISLDVYKRGVQDLKDSTSAFDLALADLGAKSRGTVTDLADALGDAAAGTRDLSDGLKQVLLQALRTHAIQPFIDNLFAVGLGGFKGGGEGGGFGGFIKGAASSFSSIFGGFRADGGPVVSGMSYIVGENGPELFTPGASGAITPNGAGGPQKIVNVTQNVYTNDASSFKASRRDIARRQKRDLANA